MIGYVGHIGPVPRPDQWHRLHHMLEPAKRDVVKACGPWRALPRPSPGSGPQPAARHDHQPGVRALRDLPHMQDHPAVRHPGLEPAGRAVVAPPPGPSSRHSRIPLAARETSDTKLGTCFGCRTLTSRSTRTSPDIDIDMAQKAKKGSARDTVGIFVHIDAQLHRAYLEAVAERDITKRRLIEAALRRELADPTIAPARRLIRRGIARTSASQYHINETRPPAGGGFRLKLRPDQLPAGSPVMTLKDLSLPDSSEGNAIPSFRSILRPRATRGVSGCCRLRRPGVGGAGAAAGRASPGAGVPHRRSHVSAAVGTTADGAVAGGAGGGADLLRRGRHPGAGHRSRRLPRRPGRGAAGLPRRSPTWSGRPAGG